MATKAHDVSIAPSTLPGTVDTWYALQNIGSVTVFLAVAPQPPDVSTRQKRVLPPGSSYEVQAHRGEQIYLWSAYGGGVVSFEETA